LLEVLIFHLLLGLVILGANRYLLVAPNRMHVEVPLIAHSVAERKFV
jgi:hypothetical protein